MSKKAGNNKTPNIIIITRIFDNIDKNNAKKFRKEAIEEALSKYRDTSVTIKDTNSLAEINKKGIEKTFSGKVTEEKIQTADNIKEIIEEGIYGYTTQDKSDKDGILFHHFFAPVKYNNSNSLARIVIKEYTKNKTMNDKYYYHQLEYIENIKNKDTDSILPRKSGSKTGESISSIDNSISQKTETVKSDKNTATNKSTQEFKNNTIQYDNQGRKLTSKQAEYFKNSKVRDEKGNLLVVYHGTNNAGFTKFKRNVNYFSDSKEVAQTYTGNEGIYEGYINIENPIVIDANKEVWSKIDIGNISIDTIENIENFLNKYGASTWKEGGKVRTSTADLVSAISDAIDENVFKADGIIIKNIYDEGAYSGSVGTKLGNDYITFKSNQFKNNINTKPTVDDDIRYMKRNNSKTTNTQVVTDNQGRKLSKQQQEYFKDSKVRNNNGNLLTTYHGSDFEFNIFKDKKAQHGRAITDGYYFTTVKENAESYGKNLKEVYLDIKNPFYLHDNNGVVPELRDRGYDIFDLIQNSKLDTDEGGYPTAKSLKKFIRKEGYDGIITLSGKKEIIDVEDSNTQIVVFKSNQIKNIGNINPTSNEDIRFAKRTAKSQNENIDKTQRNAEREGNYIEQEIQKIESAGQWDNSIPVTKLTDIRKTIEDYLGLGVKKGHFRQQAYAIYKSNRDVIRTKEYKDMDSILHETGHALDIGNRLKVDKESISSELLTAIDKLGGYEQETRTIRLEEGFAEVIREYTIVPEQAKLEYPQTIAILEKLRQTDKGFNNFISKVQEQTYNYIHQNPRNRTLSNVSIGEQTDKSPLTKNWLKQEIMRNIYDKDWVVKSVVNEMQKANGKTINQLKASNNAYFLTRLATGIGDKVTSMLSDGYIDEQGNKLMPGLNQIGEILGNNSQRFDDLRAYLVARRDTDYKSKTLKTGIRSMDSKAVIEQFKNDTQIQEASKLIYDTLDGVMQYAVNNGLITQETADNLKESNAFYVPMQRVLENKGNQVGRRGAVADIVKARTGSELDIKDVLENIIANSSNVIQQVENNNILKAFYNQGQESGLTGSVYDVIDTPMIKLGTARLETWKGELEKQGIDTSNLDLEKTIDLFAPNNKVDSQNLITSFINENGKRVYLQFNDEILFNSLMNMDKKFMSQVLKINSKMNMPLRYGATMANIGFAIPNMISDTAQAAIYSTAGFIPVVDNALGVLDILAATNKTVGNFVNKVAPQYAEKINKLYALYNQSGATNSTRLSQYRDSTQNVMKDVYGTKKSETLGIKEKYKPLKRLLDLMTYIPEISEQSTRFEVFKKNYEYYKDKGNSEMDTRIMAALESRDATQDFGRTGNITREINQLIPFSAARVGSAYTFAEKVKANPKQVGMRIALLTALAMAIKGLGYDDKEIEELNQRKKDDNFVFKIGDNVITIKKPQGILRSMINLAEYIQDLATGHIEEGKEGERLGEWINNAIMDNMPADSVTGLVPNMVAPLIENAINKDFYYNTNIVKSYDLELPDAEQYYDYNSQLAIFLGKVFNYSPAKIDNIISGYFGGLGTQVTNMIDTTLGKLGITAQKPEMGAESNAVGKRFVVNVNTNSASIDEIYNKKTELTKKKNGGDITEKETAELESINEAISNMSKLNKQVKEIKKDLSMSGKEKADQIKLLQQQRTDIARQALGKDLLYSTNASRVQSITFYPSNSTLKKSGYSLELTAAQKEEYEQIASDYYNKNKSLYNKEKLDDLKSKAKDYAKNQLMQKYKNNLVKTKK